MNQYRFFYMFLTFLFALISLSIALCTIKIYETYEKIQDLKISINENIPSVSIGAYAILVICFSIHQNFLLQFELFITVLYMYHSCLLLRNMTTQEQVKRIYTNRSLTPFSQYFNYQLTFNVQWISFKELLHQRSLRAPSSISHFIRSYSSDIGRVVITIAQEHGRCGVPLKDITV